MEEEPFQFVRKSRHKRGQGALKPSATAAASAALSSLLASSPEEPRSRHLRGMLHSAAEVDRSVDGMLRSILQRAAELWELPLRASLELALAAFLSAQRGESEAFDAAAGRAPRESAAADRSAAAATTLGGCCTCVEIVAYGMGTLSLGTNTAVQIAALLLIRRIVLRLSGGEDAAAAAASACIAPGFLISSPPPPASDSHSGAADIDSAHASPDGAPRAASAACALRVSCFDPMMTAVDRELMQSCGVAVIDKDEACARASRQRCRPCLCAGSPLGGGSDSSDGALASSLRVPLIVFMPHCDLALYENLLRANAATLPTLALIGNGMAWYRAQRDVGGGGGAASACAEGAASNRVLKGAAALTSSPLPPAAAAAGAPLRHTHPQELFWALAATAQRYDASAIAAVIRASSRWDEPRAAPPLGARVFEIPLPLADCDVLVERALDATR